jgi:type IV pilus assembly protein PilQ
MQYKYRWYYIAALIAVLLTLGSLFDLAPRWHELATIQQEEKALRVQIAALPVTHAVQAAPAGKVDKTLSLPIVMRLANEQHIVISNMSESANKRVHFSARANYADMLLFHAALLRENSATLAEFSYQAIGDNTVRFGADITSLNNQQSDHQLNLQAHNPFCGQQGSNAALETYGNAADFALDLQNGNLSDTVRLLAKMLRRNVIVSPAVEGSVTLHLQHAHPAHVFDLLLDSYGLGKWQRGNVWYVAPRDELIKRKQQEAKWQHLSLETAELATITLQIHYGNVDSIARLLKDGKASFLSARGHVRVDLRTNVICIQDVPERMVVIRQLIARLDRPAQQVRIEARLASVDNDFERELGVDFSVKAPGENTATPGRYSIAVAHLPDGSQLDVKLAALENNGHANLISSPSLYTANQQPAAIEAGEEVPYQEVSESGGTAVVFKKAVLSLKVTPQVLPGGYVLLQLHINQDRPSSHLVLGMPTISTRQILTSVMVKSGQTAVLGGIYENQDEKALRRIPLLGSVPVIGELFTLHASRQTKRELLIFVTPKIMTEPL